MWEKQWKFEKLRGVQVVWLIEMCTLQAATNWIKLL